MFNLDHRHFDKALKSGSVKAKISKAIVQGPARAGKTSVKCLVLRQRYTSNKSTSAIESPQIAVNTGEFSVACYGKSDDNVHWELVDSKRMVRKFASEIRSLIAKIESEEDSSPSLELLEEDIFDDEMELIDLVSKAKQLDSPLTLHKEWLYFIDCGGQIQFQQLVQAFIPCASVLLLVTDLSKALSSQSSAVFQYAEGEDSTIQVSDYLPSVDTLLRRLTLMVTCDSFQSHSAGASALSDKIKVPEQLKVVAIGTHGDIYENLQRRGEEVETIHQKEEKLSQIFQPIMFKLSRYDGEVLYQVDGRNSKKGVFDDPSIKEIRAELRDQAFEVNIPLSWYAFEIMLREKAFCGILSLETCKTIGAKINLDETEVQSALKFFHLLNTILYYPGVSNLVFVKPESLIDVIRELMVYICKRRENVKAGRETQDMIEAAKKGFVTKNVFKNFEKCKKILDFFPNFSKELLNIFQHLLIATEMPGEKATEMPEEKAKEMPEVKFFMPALLPLTDPSCATSSNKSLLMYYFDKGVPLGLFCAMIVNLLIRRIAPTKRFCDNSVWKIDPTSTVYSNQVTLKYHKIKWRNVVFVESNDCYEIYFEHTDDKKIGEEAIDYILDNTITNRKFSVSPVKAIFCPCSFEQSRHFAIEHECNQFVCTKSGNPSTEKDVNDMSLLKGVLLISSLCIHFHSMYKARTINLLFIFLGVIEIPQQPLTHREMLIPQQSGKVPKLNIPIKLIALFRYRL